NFFAYPIFMESDNENNLDNVTNSEFENNLSSSSSKKLSDSSENKPQSKKLRNQKTTYKILIPSKEKKVECGATYKYDGEMGNMQYHLQVRHNIYSPNQLDNLKNKNQLKITDMLSNVRPYKAPKQAELCNVTVEWLITDLLPLNTIHKKGYHKMIQKFDP
ncbi:11544_t:CDS:2, partial [Cetraspora pellucida]